MSLSKINNGDTGLDARTKINDAFDAVDGLVSSAGTSGTSGTSGSSGSAGTSGISPAGGAAITSLGDIEYSISKSWNSPIKLTGYELRSNQIIERQILVIPIVVKDGQVLNDFMFEITQLGAGTGLGTMDLGVYNSATFSYTSGSSTLTSLKPNNLLGSVTGIDITSTGFKILNDINITMTGGVSNVYYIYLANFNQTSAGNPYIRALGQNNFGNQYVEGNGKFVIPDGITSFNQVRATDFMVYYQIPTGITSFPSTITDLNIGNPDGNSSGFLPLLFWR